MAQPMMKTSGEDLAPQSRAETLARARELREKLGRPLRMEIGGRLSDDELEEVVLARLEDGERVSADGFLEEFGKFIPRK